MEKSEKIKVAVFVAIIFVVFCAVLVWFVPIHAHATLFGAIKWLGWFLVGMSVTVVVAGILVKMLTADDSTPENEGTSAGLAAAAVFLIVGLFFVAPDFYQKIGRKQDHAISGSGIPEEAERAFIAPKGAQLFDEFAINGVIAAIPCSLLRQETGRSTGNMWLPIQYSAATTCPFYLGGYASKYGWRIATKQEVDSLANSVRKELTSDKAAVVGDTLVVPQDVSGGGFQKFPSSGSVMFIKAPVTSGATKA